MKTAISLALSTLVLVLAGCRGTGMVAITPDPATGKMTKKTYTKYYDAGVWLVPGHLGMSVVVDQLGEYSAKITIYAWNRDKEKRAIKIQSISSGSRKVFIEKSDLLAIGDERSGLEVGQMEVLNYGTLIELEVAYELDGVAGKASLRLERRTPEELERYFGKNGKPPYPWFHDQGGVQTSETTRGK
jgi:hypothetical protein